MIFSCLLLFHNELDYLLLFLIPPQYFLLSNKHPYSRQLLALKCEKCIISLLFSFYFIFVICGFSISFSVSSATPKQLCCLANKISLCFSKCSIARTDETKSESGALVNDY